MKRLALSFGLAVFLCGAITARADEPEFTFQTVIFPTDITFTQLLSINSASIIAGYHGATINKGFVLMLPSNFISENFPRSAQTQVTGIDNSNNTTGFYIDSSGRNHGFYRIGSHGPFTSVDFLGTNFNQLLGRNNLRQDVGFFMSGTHFQGYMYDEQGGVFRELFIPGAVNNQATGINDKEQLSGFYVDGHGVTHGFLLSPGKFTKLDFPGATFTQALGLNNHGVVVGVYMDRSNKMHGFVYNPNAFGIEEIFDSIDDPNGIGTTTINGINDQGKIVGFYVDSAGNTDGFVGTPIE